MPRFQKRIAHDVANASRATTGKQVRAYPATLIAEARTLERLQAERRKLRRALRNVESRIKHARKLLKALAGAEAGEVL